MTPTPEQEKTSGANGVALHVLPLLHRMRPEYWEAEEEKLMRGLYMSPLLAECRGKKGISGIFVKGAYPNPFPIKWDYWAEDYFDMVYHLSLSLCLKAQLILDYRGTREFHVTTLVDSYCQEPLPNPRCSPHHQKTL